MVPAPGQQPPSPSFLRPTAPTSFQFEYKGENGAEAEGGRRTPLSPAKVQATFEQIQAAAKEQEPVRVLGHLFSGQHPTE